MSRRINQTETRVEQNRQTLKTLVKLEGNKSCADCKRNKHPRWASWNLGIFICIRCSGIHRGMGTHISRVKSVDLDSWTDEQLQSMLRWGNSRANKYWEAKLAPGHVPSEAKIENFIRTKYESKRWVMDGPMPDPATLDVDGDDDVPLNVVQEKAKLERSASQKATASRAASASKSLGIDLIGQPAGPARPSTGPPGNRVPPPKAEPPKPAKPADSLLGLDFFGGSNAAPPARPSSTTGAASNAASRPDLKQSILSLYASVPKQQPQVQAQPQAQVGSGGFGIGPPAQQSAFGGLDAFSSLNLGSAPAPQLPKPSPFADLAASMASPKATPAPPHTTKVSLGGGGNFFNAAPPAAKPTPPPTQRSVSSSNDFGDIFASSNAPLGQVSAPPPKANNDLFDLMSAPPLSPPKATTPAPAPAANSVFNLSAPAPAPKPQPAAPAMSAAFDPWGSNEAWGDVTTAPAAPATSSATTGAWDSGNGFGNGFGVPKAAVPQVSADEDFGGWSSAPAPPHPGTKVEVPKSKPGGGFGGDDLFSNVWE
ncbi:ArfGap-domain-containing protein [Trichodelitschia bisporula]|uniref:ArfGap-domain-containing protein n=1 Tax=Trichodelitschia bisporula TaxID=703511 RepID=A0A6G1HM84_9PEZI|nr:ArfGap-domain-containing protein [Trichodelitschia bisporula]